MLEIMTWIIQALKDTDEPLLWEMLYQALYVPEGQAALSREIIYSSELARYVRGWGHDRDCGFMVIDSLTQNSDHSPPLMIAP